MRQQNFHKKAHTARFLQTFHSGISSTGRDYRAEMNYRPEVEATEAAAVAFVMNQPAPSTYVAKYEGVEVLHGEGLLTEAQAKYVVSIATGREGVTEGMMESLKARLLQGLAKRAASEFISRYKDLPRKAPTAAQVPVSHAPAATVEIPAHRYGIHRDGEVKCYAIDYGKEDTKWAGFLFVNRISSDDRFPIRNAKEKAEILAQIQADGIEASQLLAALTIRRCIRCGRGLSDTKNPYFTQGLGPECGSK
jgi:hypothetical protein